MKLKDLIPYIENENVCIMTELDCGTKEKFHVDIVRGTRIKGSRQEWKDWLYALDLKVRSISFTNSDALNNKNMLCVHCYPIKVVSE